MTAQPHRNCRSGWQILVRCAQLRLFRAISHLQIFTVLSQPAVTIRFVPPSSPDAHGSHDTAFTPTCFVSMVLTSQVSSAAASKPASIRKERGRRRARDGRAVGDKAIFMRPCIFHWWASIKSIQGRMKMSLPPMARPWRRRPRRGASGGLRRGRQSTYVYARAAILCRPKMHTPVPIRTHGDKMRWS